MTDNKELKRAETILSILGLKWDDLKEKKILDLGAGYAELARIASEKGISVVCLDKKYHDNIPTTLEYIIADAESIPFPDNSFELVLSVGVLSDIKEISSFNHIKCVLQEVKRILRKGGEFRFGSGVGNKSYIKNIEPNIEMVYVGNNNKKRPQYYYKLIKS